MKKLASLMLVAASLTTCAQSLSYKPPAYGAYLTTDGVNFSPWTAASGSGASSTTPQPIGLYCQAAPPNGPWTPCAPASGSGSGTVNSGSAFAPAYYPSSTTAVSSPTAFNGPVIASTTAAPTGPTGTCSGAASYIDALGACHPASAIGTTAQIPVYPGSGGAAVAQTVSGDSLINASGLMTNTGINGTQLSNLASGLLANTTGTGKPVVITSLPSGTTAYSGGSGNQVATNSDIAAASGNYLPSKSLAVSGVSDTSSSIRDNLENINFAQVALGFPNEQSIQVTSASASQATPATDSVYSRVFPNGYGPWISGLDFTDYATTINGGGLSLGVADNNGDSQSISFIAQRKSDRDMGGHLYVYAAGSTNILNFDPLVPTYTGQYGVNATPDYSSCFFFNTRGGICHFLDNSSTAIIPGSAKSITFQPGQSSVTSTGTTFMFDTASTLCIGSLALNTTCAGAGTLVKFSATLAGAVSAASATFTGNTSETADAASTSMTTPHLIGSGTAPTIVGSGTGTAAITASLDSFAHDGAFTVTFVTSTAPPTSLAFAAVTFGTAWGNRPHCTDGNKVASTAGSYGLIATEQTTTTMTFSVGTTALSPSTTYKEDILCVQ